MNDEQFRDSLKNNPDFAASRHRATNNLRAYGAALYNMKYANAVAVRINTVDTLTSVDLSDEPEVIEGMKLALHRKIAEANQQLLELGGHLIQ
jgi:hypothetical protein